MTRVASSTAIAQPPRVPSVAVTVVTAVAAPDHDLHDVARLVAPERVGHRLQVGDVHVADPGDDVVAPEPRLLGRASGADAEQPDAPGIVGHVGHGAEIGAVARRVCGGARRVAADAAA